MEVRVLGWEEGKNRCNGDEEQISGLQGGGAPEKINVGNTQSELTVNPAGGVVGPRSLAF